MTFRHSQFHVYYCLPHPLGLLLSSRNSCRVLVHTLTWPLCPLYLNRGKQQGHQIICFSYFVYITSLTAPLTKSWNLMNFQIKTLGLDITLTVFMVPVRVMSVVVAEYVAMLSFSSSLFSVWVDAFHVFHVSSYLHKNMPKGRLDWCTTQGVFLLHIHCSWDMLWIHEYPDKDKAVTVSE